MRVAGLAYAVLILAFLYAPLAVLYAFSFNASRLSLWHGFTFDWYRQLLHDSLLLESTANSLLIALGATAMATLLGTMAAYALWKRTRSPLVTAGLYLSLVTPEVVTGVSLLLLFQLAFRLLPIRLGLHTVVLAHVSFSLVYVVVVVLARLRSMDPILEQAALDLGARPFSVFRFVTLPLLLPAVLAGALLCFTISLDDYVITSMVAGVDSETLPMAIYAMARRGVSPEVNAISAVITTVVGAFILLAARLEHWRQ